MQALYRSQETKPMDAAAAAYLQIDSLSLMQRAALSIYRHINTCESLLVVTGPGNNGGDGWVLAELARQDHKRVLVWALKKPDELSGDAAKAAADYQGEVVFLASDIRQEFTVVVDAIFGTGLSRTLTGVYSDAINYINQLKTKVLSVDIPSGLVGDTGVAFSPMVQADLTVAVLNLMPGHFTADGQDCCGELILETLDVSDHTYASIKPAAYLLDKAILDSLKLPRKHNSHKGSYGRILVAGGQHGMLGAVLLAATAGLTTGAGLVQVITTEQQAPTVPLYRPELMALGFQGSEVQINIPTADVLVLGMGLGTSHWSKALWQQLIKASIPTVLDADGLNLLADFSDDSKLADSTIQVITPHPKEAARLLNCSVKDIQADRIAACETLAKRFQCVAVLKGSGTIISEGENSYICPYGSADLATAGTGDVLAGMIGSLMAQGFSPLKSAQMAVVWHALAADNLDLGRCLTASGLIAHLPEILR